MVSFFKSILHVSFCFTVKCNKMIVSLVMTLQDSFNFPFAYLFIFKLENIVYFLKSLFQVTNPDPFVICKEKPSGTFQAFIFNGF